MRLIRYVKLRKVGFSHLAAKSIAERPIAVGAAWYFGVAAVAVLLGIATATAQASIAHDASLLARSSAEARVERLEKIVVTCLNGGFFSVDGVIHECKAESMGVKL